MAAKDDDIADSDTARRYEVCECGDFRHQHVNGTGASTLNWDNFKGVESCVKFRPRRPDPAPSEGVK